MRNEYAGPSPYFSGRGLAPQARAKGADALDQALARINDLDRIA